MVHSNQQILTNFFVAIVRVVSEGTSDKYAVMVIKNFDKVNKKKFPFLRYIDFQLGKIIVNEKINSIDPKLVSKFITKLMDSLFSDLFKHLIRKKISVGLYEDLKKLGVKI